MSVMKIIIIVYILAIKSNATSDTTDTSNATMLQLNTSVQYDDSFVSYFEDAEFPKSDAIPMLNRKVFRGERVSITEHPYVVSVRRLYAHYVTGTLLTKNLVVTVAHPLYLVSPSELGVVVGENYSDRGTAMLTVLLVVIHEDFSPYTLSADIALLRLYEDVITRVAVKTLPLISPFLSLNGLTGFVTGWGRCDRTGKELCLPRSSMYFHGERLDPMLRTIKFTLLTNDSHCDAYIPPEGQMDKGMLCVGTSRSEEPMCPCMAVPGAPLVVDSRLAGLQSWGFGCGYTRDLPVIYTSIQYYIRWLVFNIPILRNVSKHNLTDIFLATKIQILSDWLIQTRVKRPKSQKLPNLEVQAINVDILFSKLKGTVYDVRDFVNNGIYREQKSEMYNTLKLQVQKEDILKEIMSLRKLDTKPFLSNQTITENGIVVKNGSVYTNDSIYDTETIAKV